MSKDKRLKVKSDYSLLRNRHKKISDGSIIYENDLMTISNMDQYFSDQIQIASDSNFKFSYRGGMSMQKKRHRGNWSVAEPSSNENIQTSETTIKIKPDYTSISDYAYFGSSVELLNCAVNKITEEFPAELYFSEGIRTIDGVDYYAVSNDFEIDIDSESVGVNGQYNHLRYFCESVNEYVIITKNSLTKLSDCHGVPWYVEKIDAKCQDRKNGAWVATVYLYDGAFELYVWEENGKKYIYYRDKTLIGGSVRPLQKYIETFFDSLSPFESSLLNRHTNPIFSSKFEDYIVTDSKNYRIERTFTWPSENDYSPRIDGSSFTEFISNLIELCQKNDMSRSDNIWRKMTHESIKNLDWTFQREIGDDVEDLSDIDSTRIEAMCHLYGRVYDDIKSYIDGIKCVNNITYDKIGNTTDYVLSDVLENHGFDAYALNISNNNSLITPRLYLGERLGYTSSDANIEFTRRLILNSKYIFSTKGTRKSIDEILALFGFDKDEYEVKEYVVVASGRSGYTHYATEEEPIIDVRYPLACDIRYINERRALGRDTNSFNVGEYGLPLADITLTTEDGREQSYVVPWFSKKKNYDGDLYFQQYGGWGKVLSKQIHLDIAPNVTELRSSNLFRLYGETISPLKFARDLDALIELRESDLVPGDVCYVSDVSKILFKYNFTDEAEKGRFENGEFSNYFVLDKIELSTWLGLYESTKEGNIYGWRNVFEEEFNTTNDKLTEAGKKVLYYESITDEMRGNNQHGGNGNYDSGESYIEAMTKPFRYAARHEEFTWFDGNLANEFKDYGFEPQEYVDDKKCWFFTNTLSERKLYIQNPNYDDASVRSEYENI